jgi:hypothetical protein
MRYTHIGMEDKAKAVARLPALVAPPGGGEKCSAISNVALHGRCISGVTIDNPVTLDDSGDSGKKRQNPCCGKGFVADRRQLARSDSKPAAGVEPATPALRMRCSAN